MIIFVLEDDPDQAELLQHILIDAGHQCSLFQSGRTLIRDLPFTVPDLVILDWNVPGLSGIEVMEWIKASEHKNTPILFATTRATEEDVVQALTQGADDYLIKPIRAEELKARIEVIGRRIQTEDNAIDAAPYVFDDDACTISFNQQQVKLTVKEYQLAKYFFQYPNRIFARDKLLQSIWTKNASITTRTVDTHISRLRKKMLLDGSMGWQLVSVYHQGYKLIRNNTSHEKQSNE